MRVRCPGRKELTDPPLRTHFMRLKRLADVDDAYCDVTVNIGACLDFVIAPCNGRRLLRANDIATVQRRWHWAARRRSGECGECDVLERI